MSTQFILPRDNRETVIAKIAEFLAVCLPGRKVKVQVQQYRAVRSEAQNSYLWGVCYATIERATGQEAEDWHEYFLGEWGGWEQSSMFGRKRIKPLRRSSKLDTAEFASLVAFIQRRAAENGIYIPDPDPLLMEERNGQKDG